MARWHQWGSSVALIAKRRQAWEGRRGEISREREGEGEGKQRATEERGDSAPQEKVIRREGAVAVLRAGTNGARQHATTHHAAALDRRRAAKHTRTGER